VSVSENEVDVNDRIGTVFSRESREGNIDLASCDRLISVWNIVTVDPAFNFTDLKE